MTYEYITRMEYAELVATWMATHGGILVWLNEELPELELSWATPAQTASGRSTWKPPHSLCGMGSRKFLVTDPAKVGVDSPVEFQRIPVDIQIPTTADGFKFRLTDACSKMVRKSLKKAGDGSFCRVDDDSNWKFVGNDIVICRAGNIQPLTAWVPKPGTAPTEEGSTR